MLKFVVGLTDVIDYDGFIYSDNSTNQTINYNIRKPTMDIEKAVLEWKINTDLDATRNSVMLWEKIIRMPHLCMIGIEVLPFNLMPDYNEYYINLAFINLLPVSNDIIKTFTDSDYDNTVFTPKFGDLCISIEENIDIIDPHSANINSAFYENNIHLLPDSSIRGSVLPKFRASFRLEGNVTHYSLKNNKEFNKFINDNKEVLESKGYDISSNRIMNYGTIPIGSLLTDPEVVYEHLTKYPRICRTSFVQTEE